MREQAFGSIAALEFRFRPTQGFEDIVEELDIAFQPSGLTRRSLHWDSADIAIIERDNLRILLGWLAPLGKSQPGYLVLAVGSAPMGGKLCLNKETCAYVKDMLVTHLESYLTVEQVLHADATERVEATLMDNLSRLLRHDPEAAEPDQDPVETVDDGDTIETESAHPVSLPQRLTIYTLGATMLLYTPPVGASLLVYSTLRDLISDEGVPA